LIQLLLQMEDRFLDFSGTSDRHNQSPLGDCLTLTTSPPGRHAPSPEGHESPVASCACIWGGLDGLFLGLENLFHQRWDHLEQVADDAVVGYLKNRRVRVLINGYYGFRSLHAD
jgi:hypothetical protein